MSASARRRCEAKGIAGLSKKPSGYLEHTTGTEKFRPAHVVLMEKHIGRRIKKDEVVHHKDENKTNNIIDNLELMTRAEHSKLHALINIKGRTRDEKGKASQMLNRIMFVGFLGKDAEVRYMPNGNAVANFSVASTEKWKDKASGEPQERTEWLRCNAFDKLAEICGEYLTKGKLVYVDGPLQTRKYTDKDGVERYSTECRVQTMKMLGSGKSDDGDRPPEQRENRAAAKERTKPQQSTGFDNMDDDNMDDDIPF